MKLKLTILLNSVEKIKAFVNLAVKYDADFDIQSGRCLVDGKSIMGIFALNTSMPHILIVNYRGDKENIEELKAALREFLYTGD